MISVLGVFIGDKFFNIKQNLSGLFLVISAITISFIITVFVLSFSNIPLKTTFGRLVLFSVLLINGIAINIYIYHLKKKT